MMQKKFPNGLVTYKALDLGETLTADEISLSQQTDMTTMRREVEKVFPFSVFATDAMVFILREVSRLNQVDEFIYDINTGLQFDGCKTTIPYKEKVSFLIIQDICIQPMFQIEVESW